MKAEDIKRVFHAWKMIFQEHVEQLTALDSVGGDGDLGVVMRDGFRIADEFVTACDEQDIGRLVYMAGKKFNSVASSSMAVSYTHLVRRPLIRCSCVPFMHSLKNVTQPPYMCWRQMDFKERNLESCICLKSISEGFGSR